MHKKRIVHTGLMNFQLTLLHLFGHKCILLDQTTTIVIVENPKKNNAHKKPQMSKFDPNYYQRNQGLKIILKDFGYQHKTNENYRKWKLIKKYYTTIFTVG